MMNFEEWKAEQIAQQNMPFRTANIYDAAKLAWEARVPKGYMIVKIEENDKNFEDCWLKYCAEKKDLFHNGGPKFAHTNPPNYDDYERGFDDAKSYLLSRQWVSILDIPEEWKDGRAVLLEFPKSDIFNRISCAYWNGEFWALDDGKRSVEIGIYGSPIRAMLPPSIHQEENTL